MIELLVVIGVIALLVALTFPALTSGLQDSKRVQCTNQLRQIGAAVISYEGDNKGAFPPAFGNYFQQDVTWLGPWYNPGVGRTLGDMIGLSAYTGGTNALIALSVCPLNHSTTAVGGTVNNPIGYPYTVNYYLLPTLGGTIARSINLPQPSKIVVMLDSSMATNWGLGLQGADSAHGGPRAQESHLETANVLWADGHVSSSKKADLNSFNFNISLPIH